MHLSGQCTKFMFLLFLSTLASVFVLCCVNYSACIHCLVSVCSLVIFLWFSSWHFIPFRICFLKCNCSFWGFNIWLLKLWNASKLCSVEKRGVFKTKPFESVPGKVYKSYCLVLKTHFRVVLNLFKVNLQGFTRLSDFCFIFAFLQLFS